MSLQSSTSANTNPRRWYRITLWPPIAMLILMTTLTALTTVFVLNQERIRHQDVDLHKTSKAVRFLINKDLLSMESIATRLAHNEALFAAVEAIDQTDAQRALQDLKYDRSLWRIALVDFDKDSLAFAGHSLPPKFGASTASFIDEALKGVQTSFIDRLDGRAAFFATVPIGYRESPSGVLIMTQFLSSEMLAGYNHLVPNTLSLADGGTIISSTMPREQQSSVTATLTRLRGKAIANDLLDSGLLISPLPQFKGSGQLLLVSSQTIVPQTIPWVLLAQAFLGTLLMACIGIWLLARTSSQRLEEETIRISDWIKKHEPNGDLLQSPTVRFLAPVADAFYSYSKTVLQSDTQARSYRQRLEKRFSKVSEVLGLDNGAFKLFSDKMCDFDSYVTETLDRFEEEGQDKFGEIVIEIFRLTHTIKSNAKLFNLAFIHKEAQTLEDYLERLRRSHATGQSQELNELRRLHRILLDEVESYRKLRIKLLGPQSVTNSEVGEHGLQLQWLTSLIGRLFAHIKAPQTDPEVLEGIHREFERALATVGKEDASSYIRLYDNMMKPLAARMGKKVDPIAFSGNIRFLNAETMHLLNDMLLHCLRNSIFHGIEPTKQRSTVNKSGAGRLSVHLHSEGNRLKVLVSDDGAGINTEKIRRKAIDVGLRSKDQLDKLSPEEIGSLIFESGLSTADQVTDVAGRGLGMDIVLDLAQIANGKAYIESTSQAGTTIAIEIDMPPSRFMTRHSIFDFGIVFQNIASRFSPLLFRNGITVLPDDSFKNRNLVYADHALLTQAFRHIFLAIGSYASESSTINVSTKRSCGRFIVQFDSDGLTTEEWLSSGIDSTVGSVLGLSFMNLESHDRGITLTLPDMVPCNAEEHELNILLLTDQEAKVRDHLNHYLLVTMASWPHSVFNDDSIEEFVQATTNRIALVVVDEHHFLAESLQHKIPHLSKMNLIVASKDPAAMKPDIIFGMNNDPLIVEGDLDKSSIDQSIERTLLDLIEHEVFEEDAEDAAA